MKFIAPTCPDNRLYQPNQPSRLALVTLTSACVEWVHQFLLLFSRQSFSAIQYPGLHAVHRR